MSARAGGCHLTVSNNVKREPVELLQGTLDLLILRALGQGSMHGFGVARCIEETSLGSFQVGEGSLYPALHRMEEKGLIKSGWGKTEGNRRARFYAITGVGKEEMERASEKWRRYAVAVELILQLR